MVTVSIQSSPNELRKVIGTSPNMKPKVLVVAHGVRSLSPSLSGQIDANYHIINYDCDNTDECKRRMMPGGLYSEIDAIVETGWKKSAPFLNHNLFSGDMVQAYPSSVKIVSCSGHGYDAADIPTLTARGVWYCNTPDACTTSVANTAIFLILNVYRYFGFAEHCVRIDAWSASRALGSVAIDPIGQTLGVVGLGSIGLATAQKAATALEMRVHYYDPRRKPDAEARISGGAVWHTSLSSLLQVADCICLACPLTKETHHLMGTAEFAAAKQGLRVVNVARGQLIDEEALITAMITGKVCGVGLDVHENEPVVDDRLKNDPMVTVLPHIGVCSQTCWGKFERRNWENIDGFFLSANKKPLTPVNVIE
ncbi:hypothetical protein D6C95_03405 [Aureobasidium pullulans]|nr:hypothetical protein D6C95_03405 [Aureobasidium pullulans]